MTHTVTITMQRKTRWHWLRRRLLLEVTVPSREAAWDTYMALIEVLAVRDPLQFKAFMEAALEQVEKL